MLVPWGMGAEAQGSGLLAGFWVNYTLRFGGVRKGHLGVSGGGLFSESSAPVKGAWPPVIQETRHASHPSTPQGLSLK